MGFKKRLAKCIQRLRVLFNDRQHMEIIISRFCMYAHSCEAREDNAAATKQSWLIVPSIHNDRRFDQMPEKVQLDEFINQFEQWLDREEAKQKPKPPLTEPLVIHLEGYSGPPKEFQMILCNNERFCYQLRGSLDRGEKVDK